MEEHGDEFGHLEESIKKLVLIKYRDILYETVQEYNRSGEFIRIFPSRGSKQYEKYFSGVFGTRMLNRIVHKVLFTNEIIPYERPGKAPVNFDLNKKITDPKNLKYETEGVP
jgi:hypothetical protein